jgi:hypothetical protein
MAVLSIHELVVALATQFPLLSRLNPDTHVFAEHENGKLNTYEATFDDFPSLFLHWFHLYPTTDRNVMTTSKTITTMIAPAPILPYAEKCS